MKNLLRALLPAVALAALPAALQAQPDAHYVPGSEGIKGASLPPPGIYFRDYNIGYLGEQVNNGAGDMAAPANFEAITYANVPRVIWITGKQFLGGNLGADALVPLVYNSLSFNDPKAGKFNSSTFGLGDAFAEGTLSWHPQQFDLALGAGAWAPTGASGKPTSAGSGFWTPMLTLGATWYPDTEKTWAVSLLNRYEFNSKDRDNHVTPGQAWTMEWAVSKSVTKTVDLGVVGYYQQRITASTGNEPLAQALYPYSRVAAIGPEINVVIPSQALFVSLRYNYEFLADNRAQGHTVTLTLTKAF